MEPQLKKVENNEPARVFDQQYDHQREVKRSTGAQRIATLKKLKAAIQAREADVNRRFIRTYARMTLPPGWSCHCATSTWMMRLRTWPTG